MTGSTLGTKLRSAACRGRKSSRRARRGGDHRVFDIALFVAFAGEARLMLPQSRLQGRRPVPSLAWRSGRCRESNAREPGRFRCSAGVVSLLNRQVRRPVAHQLALLKLAAAASSTLPLQILATGNRSLSASCYRVPVSSDRTATGNIRDIRPYLRLWQGAAATWSSRRMRRPVTCTPALPVGLRA